MSLDVKCPLGDNAPGWEPLLCIYSTNLTVLIRMSMDLVLWVPGEETEKNEKLLGYIYPMQASKTYNKLQFCLQISFLS